MLFIFCTTSNFSSLVLKKVIKKSNENNENHKQIQKQDLRMHYRNYTENLKRTEVTINKP